MALSLRKLSEVFLAAWRLLGCGVVIVVDDILSHSRLPAYFSVLLKLSEVLL
jgi:hypothetical protein